MGFTIQDGTGNGNETEVNRRNQLEVRATGISEEHDISLRNGDAYFATTTDTDRTLTTANGNSYNMLYLENTSETQFLVIEKVLTSSNVAGGIVFWDRNPTVGTIGAENTHTPVNMNFQSGRTAPVTCYNWDEVGTAGLTGITLNETVKTFITGVGFTIHPIDAAIILGKGNSFLIGYENITGSAAEFECGIRFYMRDL